MWKTGQGNGLKAKCRIVYASRTHSQLAQVIQEFRNSPYNHVSSVILASRDQLCINEQLATTSDKNQMCRAKVKTRSCEYYNNIERVSIKRSVLETFDFNRNDSFLLTCCNLSMLF